MLVDAFRIAKQSNSQLSLSVVGHGPLESRTKRAIAQLDIELTNQWVSDDDLRGIIAKHGIMVLPYLSATQSGVAAFAMANGLPSIGTNVGALPEQIIHGRNGLIVCPGDANALALAILTISTDYLLAYQMAQEACLVASTLYSWESIGRQLLEELENCLGQR